MAATAAEDTVNSAAAAPKPQKMVGEWFWRFLAVVMVITVGWVVWIIYQISPQPLITPAGFEAAAKARASQDAKGVITKAPAPVAAAAAAAAAAVPAAEAPPPAETPKPPAEAAAPAPKEPPVNVDRLRLADSIETPIPERGKKK